MRATEQKNASSSFSIQPKDDHNDNSMNVGLQSIYSYDKDTAEYDGVMRITEITESNRKTFSKSNFSEPVTKAN